MTGAEGTPSSFCNAPLRSAASDACVAAHAPMRLELHHRPVTGPGLRSRQPPVRSTKARERSMDQCKPRGFVPNLAWWLRNGQQTADYQALIEKHTLASLKSAKRATTWARLLLAVDPHYYDAYVASRSRGNERFRIRGSCRLRRSVSDHLCQEHLRSRAPGRASVCLVGFRFEDPRDVDHRRVRENTHEPSQSTGNGERIVPIVAETRCPVRAQKLLPHLIRRRETKVVALWQLPPPPWTPRSPELEASKSLHRLRKCAPGSTFGAGYGNSFGMSCWVPFLAFKPKKAKPASTRPPRTDKLNAM
jgi:hypothetical protein